MAKKEGAASTGVEGGAVDASALTEDALTAAAESAEKAFASVADLDDLAKAKVEHMGDKSPIALARRGLGALPGKEKADAGKRVNVARTRISAAFDERRAVLLAERDAATAGSRRWPRPRARPRPVRRAGRRGARRTPH